jgi:hypothetical protein
MPRSQTPVVSLAAPPLTARDAAFRAKEHVGSATTYTRFRGSIPRPISSLLLAPHAELLRRTQDSLPARPAGFDRMGLSDPILGQGTHWETMASFM